MKIDNYKTSLAYEGFYSKELKTTLNYEQDIYWPSMYTYNLELINEDGKSTFIRFATEIGNLVAKWIIFYFNDEKMKKVEAFNKVAGLKEISEEHLKKNIEGITKRFKYPDSFGKVSIQINLNESIEVQILDLRIINHSSGELIYQKKGVCLPHNSEKDMKISEYRHLVEWHPQKSLVKLINLGIKKNKYPYQLFEVNYNEACPSVRVEPGVDIKLVDGDWNDYIAVVIKDQQDRENIRKLLKEAVQRNIHSL